MNHALAVAVRIVASIAALGLTPCLLTRTLLPGLGPAPFIAAAGLSAVLLNVTVCTACHLGQIPLASMPLAGAHIALLGIAVVAWRLRPTPLFPRLATEDRLLAGQLAVLALLILPVTHLTGIDTYKWQDLATAAAVERNVPWLVHPLSLYGFTPRSYPSAHPLCLAAIQIVTGLGVDWGMYLMSLTVAVTGLASAYWLGMTICAPSPNRNRYALWFALLYAFSPVFMRYTYWATGRGLFLATLPLFLVAILKLPRPRAWAGLVLTAAILPMTHRAGGVAVVLVAIASCFAGACRILKSRRRMALILVPFALAAVALSPAPRFGWPLGTPLGFTRQAVSRFAWYVPAAAAGLVAAPGWWRESPRHRLLPLLLLTLPLAFVEEMYGAMLALPFVVAATARGVQFITEEWRPAGTLLTRTLVVLTLAGALVIVVHRAAPATPRRVRAAAAFIEDNDPLGPFLLVAPGLARTQMQAYLSGCPRFNLSVPASARIQITGEPLPSYRGSLQDFIRDTIQFLRSFAAVAGIEGDWYGNPERTYYVTIDGKGQVPGATDLLYDRDGVRVYRAGAGP